MSAQAEVVSLLHRTGCARCVRPHRPRGAAAADYKGLQRAVALQMRLTIRSLRRLSSLGKDGTAQAYHPRVTLARIHSPKVLLVVTSLRAVVVLARVKPVAKGADR